MLWYRSAVETSFFTRRIAKLLTANEYQEFRDALSSNPQMGAVIRGSGGIRKVRWKAQGRGKSGGVRMIYYWAASENTILMQMVYAKNEQTTLTKEQLRVLKKVVEETLVMNDELFNELLASIREGGAILRGEAQPSRSFEIEAADVRSIRKQYNLSQSKFASLMGISAKTLQNWEQGRRLPEGPARVLLQVAAKHPDAVWDVVNSQARQRTPATANRKRHQRVPDAQPETGE